MRPYTMEVAEYCEPSQIMALVTLANDSVKARYIASTARNRIQRSIVNAKRGRNYPAVLIGRLGVSSEYRGKGLNVGSQVIDFIKSSIFYISFIKN